MHGAIAETLLERLGKRATPACGVVERGRSVVWLETRAAVEVQYNEMMQGRLRNVCYVKVTAAEAKPTAARRRRTCDLSRSRTLEAVTNSPYPPR